MPAHFARMAHGRLARIASLLLAGTLVADCSSMGDNPLTIFADPGKHQYSSCEQLAGQRKHWLTREQELRLLMDKADQSAGGGLVNLLAYKADHVAAREELTNIENAARAKNCDNPANAPGDSTPR
jgi:hypothetical protein